MLEKLALKNDIWLKMAKDICKNKDDAEDIVQDMYIKLHNVTKEINDSYVYFTLKSIWLNKVTRNKEFTKDDFSFVPCEYEQQINIEQSNKFQILTEELKKLKPHEQIIITYSSQEGLREFCRESKIAIRTVQKCRKKLKTITEKRIEDLGILYKTLPMLSELSLAMDVNNEKQN